jgi:superfamily II DNA or RNA helicase
MCPKCKQERAAKQSGKPKIKDADETIKTRFQNEFDPTSKYNIDNNLTKEVVENRTTGSDTKVGWKCSTHNQPYTLKIQQWVNGQTNCTACSGWTIPRLRALVKSLLDEADRLQLNQAELHTIFHQTGVSSSQSMGVSLLKGLHRVPHDEVRKFANGERGVCEAIIEKVNAGEDPDDAIDSLSLPEPSQGSAASNDQTTPANTNPSTAQEQSSLGQSPQSQSTHTTFQTLDHSLKALAKYSTTRRTADNWAAEFLKHSAVAKLWKSALHKETERETVQAAREYKVAADAHTYVGLTRSLFLQQYDAAKALGDNLPDGYTFTDNDGADAPPTLMQLLVASRLKEEGCPGLGNWSDTGSGKTLSAVLSMAHLGCRTTVVICPLSVAKQWKVKIEAAFSGVFEVIVLKKLPSDGKVNWASETRTRPRVVIINYAKLSKSTSQNKMYKLLTQMNGSLDMIVLDELHMVKLRKNPSSGRVEAADSDDEESAHGKEIDEELGDSIEAEKALKLKDGYLSRRREVVLNVVTRARKANKKIRTLGLTATPVVNNLKEAQSLLCIVSGKDFSHLNCPNKPTLDDVMAVHRELHIHGVRFLSEYVGAKPVEGLGANERIDATQEYMHMYNEIEKSDKGATKQKRKRNGSLRNPTRLESALARTKAKLGRVVEECLACKARKERVLVYTHNYGGGVLKTLLDGLKGAGLNVCTYTGANANKRDQYKTKFIAGKYDVMIGSQAVATGVDDLQEGCHTMIINLLPMTHAEYKQLRGRLLRIGQDEKVRIIIPMTYVRKEGSDSQCYSEDDLDWNRIRRKGQISDAAVDGEFPASAKKLAEFSPGKARENLTKWLQRLKEEGGAQMFARSELNECSDGPTETEPPPRKKRREMTAEEKAEKERERAEKRKEDQRIRDETNALFEKRKSKCRLFEESKGGDRNTMFDIVLSEFEEWSESCDESEQNAERFLQSCKDYVREYLNAMTELENQKLYFEHYFCKFYCTVSSGDRAVAIKAAKKECIRKKFKRIKQSELPFFKDKLSNLPDDELISPDVPSAAMKRLLTSS